MPPALCTHCNFDDYDGDNRITSKDIDLEWQARDTNGDGIYDEDEYVAYRPGDLNGDGQMTWEEYKHSYSAARVTALSPSGW